MTRLPFALALLAASPLLAHSTARAEEKLYEIKKVEPKVAVGATGTASLTIKVKGGWHVNDEAPISVALTTPAGVTVKKAKLTRADLAASSKESARFDIPVSATEAGKKTLAESGLTIISGDSMADAAQKVVKAVGKR